MTGAIKRHTLAALCSSALIAFAGAAQAGTVNLALGQALNTGPTPLYGSNINSNNVINTSIGPATGSILYDPTYVGGAVNPATTPWLMESQVSYSGSGAYSVNWYFTGSESSYAVNFAAPDGVSFTEGNQNNSATGGGPPLTNGSYQFLGTSNYGSGDPLALSLSWLSGSHTLDNSGLQPTPNTGAASLVFSYLDMSTLRSSGYLDLTKTAGDWFAFALNDTGSDDNHDDFVGFAQIVPGTGGGPGLTPIPAALPLFGSVLGGGIFVGKWRKRRKQKGQKASA